MLLPSAPAARRLVVTTNRRRPPPRGRLIAAGGSLATRPAGYRASQAQVLVRHVGRGVPPVRHARTGPRGRAGRLRRPGMLGPLRAVVPRRAERAGLGV